MSQTQGLATLAGCGGAQTEFDEEGSASGALGPDCPYRCSEGDTSQEPVAAPLWPTSGLQLPGASPAVGPSQTGTELLPPWLQGLSRKGSLPVLVPLLPRASSLPRAPSVGPPATPATSSAPASSTPPGASGHAAAVESPSSSPAAGTGALTAATPLRDLAAAAAGPAEAAAAAAATAAAQAVALQHRTASFVRVVLTSPLVASALVALEVEGCHPASEGSEVFGLRWTLAQMLALHLRASYATATEAELLTILWTLEAWADARRGPCTGTLVRYVKRLASFDRERALGMSAGWPTQFYSLHRALRECQLDLLQKLSWRVRVDFAAEVMPCSELLFPQQGSRGQWPWSAHMENLCAEVRCCAAVAALQLPAAVAALGEGMRAAGAEGHLTSVHVPKRQRCA